MNLYVGTSGYSYKEWKGSFYPEDLPAKDMLHYYGTKFRAVEINNTFYAMPKAPVLEGWAEAVPAEFKFVLKVPKRITHISRLKEAGDSVSYFLKMAESLKDRLGPLLFQLPPNMKKDASRLTDFLKLLPPGRRVTFEFRNATWFDDEIFALLRGHGAALCIAEDEDELAVPVVATTDWACLRLRRPEYSDAELKAWVKRVREQTWSDVYVFFRHEDEGNGPRFAQRFLELSE